MPTIKVQAGEKLRDGEVAIWERDQAHPGGEAYVARRKGGTITVARTAMVQRALVERRLIEVADDEDEPTKVRLKRPSAQRVNDATPREAGSEPTTDSGAQAPE